MFDRRRAFGVLFGAWCSCALGACGGLAGGHAGDGGTPEGGHGGGGGAASCGDGGAALADDAVVPDTCTAVALAPVPVKCGSRGFPWPLVNLGADHDSLYSSIICNNGCGGNAKKVVVTATPVDGGPSRTLYEADDVCRQLEATYYRPLQIAVGTDYVYFGEYYFGVGRIAKRGCSHELFPEEGTSGYIALSPTALYFSDGPQILSLPLAGGKATAIVPRETGGRQLVVDSANVYWIGQEFNHDKGYEYSLWKAPLTPSTQRPQRLAGPNPTWISAYFFLAADTLFVPEDTKHTVAVSTGGGPVRVLEPYALLVDDSGLYTYTGFDTGIDGGTGVCWIDKYTLDGVFAKHIAPLSCKGANIGSNLTSNERYVFWWDLVTGSIMRACK